MRHTIATQLTGPDAWIKIGQKTINVVGEADLSKKFKKDYIERKGYIANGSEGPRVWIAHTSEPSAADQQYPCFWPGEDGKTIIISNPLDEFYDQADIKFIRVRDVDTIYRESMADDDAEYDRRMKTLIRNSANMTLPVFKKGDDFLKLIVKAMMRKKMISLNGMPSTGSSQPHLLANMRSALLNSTKMSTSYFRQWMETTSFDIILYASDSGADPDHPLNVVIKYDSRRDMLSYIYPDGHEEDDPYITYLHSINPEDEPQDTVEVIESGEDDE